MRVVGRWKFLREEVWGLSAFAPMLTVCMAKWKSLIKQRDNKALQLNQDSQNTP